VQKIVFGRARAKALGFGFCHTKRTQRIINTGGLELARSHLDDGLRSIVPVYVRTICRVVLHHAMEDERAAVQLGQRPEVLVHRKRNHVRSSQIM